MVSLGYHIFDVHVYIANGDRTILLLWTFIRRFLYDWLFPIFGVIMMDKAIKGDSKESRK
jgi:hypothetical protein